MALTRFYDRSSGFDGPVSGSLLVIPITFTAGVTSAAYAHTIDLPAGMALELVDINVQCVGITSDPSLAVGTTKAGTQIAAAVNVTTNLGSLTLKATSVSAGGSLDVRVTNDSGDAFASIGVTVVGYVSAPPDSVAHENR